MIQQWDFVILYGSGAPDRS